MTVVYVADRPSTLGQCADVLAAAFADDPLMTSIWPVRDRRAAALRTYFRATMVYEHSVIGRVEFVSVDGKPAAVAAWDGLHRGSALAGLGRTVRAAPQMLLALRSRLMAGIDVRRRVDAHEPEPPHWTLVNLGVDPAHEGTGLARTLSDHRFKELDASSAGAHLVCSRAENVSLYRRFGFTVTSKLPLLDGTPLWAMDRGRR